jgi:uncharacterized protein (TIGR02001 family)
MQQVMNDPKRNKPKKERTNTMKKTLIILMLAAVMTVGAAFGAYAEDVEKSASAGVAVMSQYVWRGLILSDKAVVQPTVDFAYGPVGANIWANIDEDTHQNNETDFTVSYSGSKDKISYGVGYIYYGLNAENQDDMTAEFVDDTAEVYLTLGYDYLIAPTFTYYQDVEEGDGGGFATLGLDWGMDVNEKVSVAAGALVGYNNENLVMGTDENGDKFSDFYQGEVHGSVSFPVGPVGVDLMAAYAKSLSDDAKFVMEGVSEAVTGDKEDDVFYYGVNLSLGF